MKLLIITLFLSSYISLAQETVIQDIRNHYQKTEQEINSCIGPDAKPEGCVLYQNTLQVNSNGQQWRGVGVYDKKTEFWYEDSPQHCDECGTDGINVLTKVIVTESSASYTNRREFLYKNGKLIFVYVKVTGESETEVRYYYSEDQLIRYMKGKTTYNNEKATPYNSRYITLEGAELQELFLLSM